MKRNNIVQCSKGETSLIRKIETIIVNIVLNLILVMLLYILTSRLSIKRKVFFNLNYYLIGEEIVIKHKGELCNFVYKYFLLFYSYYSNWNSRTPKN